MGGSCFGRARAIVRSRCSLLESKRRSIAHSMFCVLGKGVRPSPQKRIVSRTLSKFSCPAAKAPGWSSELRGATPLWGEGIVCTPDPQMKHLTILRLFTGEFPTDQGKSASLSTQILPCAPCRGAPLSDSCDLIYIYIYIYDHRCMYIHILMYVYIYIYIYIYIYTYTHIHYIYIHSSHHRACYELHHRLRLDSGPAANFEENQP